MTGKERRCDGREKRRWSEPSGAYWENRSGSPARALVVDVVPLD